jgi:hypothetical protein
VTTWTWTPGQQPRAGTLYEKVPHGNTLDTFLYPHDLQLMTFIAEAPFIFLMMGQQGGKTSWGPPWVFHKMEQYPGMGAMAVGKTRDQVKESMVKKIVEFARGTVFEGTYHKQDHFYETAFGDILLKTAEEPENLQGPHPCAVWGDEPGAWAYEAWVQVRSRVDSAGCQFLGTSTPYFMNWLYHECWKAWKKGSPDYEFLIGDSLVNPSYSHAMWDMKKRILTDDQFALYMQAEFRKESGLVYPNFDRERVARRFRSVRRPCILALDPGSADPEAALVMTMEPGSGAVYVYAAYKKTDVDQGKHATELAPLMDRFFIDEVAYDPRALAAKQDLEKELARRGQSRIKWYPKTLDLEASIADVTRLLRGDLLYCDVDLCVPLFDEFESWKRNEKTGRPEERGPNHLLDAFRYGYAHLKEMRDQNRLLPSGDIVVVTAGPRKMTHSEKLFAHQIARQNGDGQADIVVNWE